MKKKKNPRGVFLECKSDHFISDRDSCVPNFVPKVLVISRNSPCSESGRLNSKQDARYLFGLSHSKRRRCPAVRDLLLYFELKQNVTVAGAASGPAAHRAPIHAFPPLLTHNSPGSALAVILLPRAWPRVSGPRGRLLRITVIHFESHYDGRVDRKDLTARV